MEKRKANIRKLTTAELKTYEAAYKRGEIYKFAAIEAKKELERRKKGKPYKKKSVKKKSESAFCGTMGGSLLGRSRW